MESGAVDRAAVPLEQAASSEGCRGCGCFHGVLIMLEDDVTAESCPPGTGRILEEARNSLLEVSHDCLGCTPCLPMEALKILKGMEA